MKRQKLMGTINDLHEAYGLAYLAYNRNKIDNDGISEEMEKGLIAMLDYIDKLKTELDQLDGENTMYVIRNTKNPSMFWNNMFGWIITDDEMEMTLFDKEQKQRFTQFPDGEWVAINTL